MQGDGKIGYCKNHSPSAAFSCKGMTTNRVAVLAHSL